MYFRPPHSINNLFRGVIALWYYSNRGICRWEHNTNICLWLVHTKNDFVMTIKNSHCLFINFTRKTITVCELIRSYIQIVRIFLMFFLTIITCRFDHFSEKHVFYFSKHEIIHNKMEHICLLKGLGPFNSNITLNAVTLKFLFILATRKHIITEQNS